MMDACDKIVYNAGDVILKTGDAETNLIIVQSGLVNVVVDDNNIVATIGPFSTIGELPYEEDGGVVKRKEEDRLSLSTFKAAKTTTCYSISWTRLEQLVGFKTIANYFQQANANNEAYIMYLLKKQEQED